MIQFAVTLIEIPQTHMYLKILACVFTCYKYILMCVEWSVGVLESLLKTKIVQFVGGPIFCLKRGLMCRAGDVLQENTPVGNRISMLNVLSFSSSHFI